MEKNTDEEIKDFPLPNFQGKQKILKSFGNSSDIDSKICYKSALKLLEEEVVEGCIFSYNEVWDCLFKDVIIPKRIVEFTGHFESTTPICMRLCVSVQLPKNCGGHGGEAFYISTNGNFCIEKLREMASDFVKNYSDNLEDFNEESILEHIYYTKVNNCVELLACILELEIFLKQKEIRLVVIDSISYVLRQLEGPERFKTTNKIFLMLRFLFQKYNLTVIISNFCTTRINGEEVYTVASFGDSFYHLVNSRICFTKREGRVHAKLVKNIVNKDIQVIFQ